MGVNGLLTASMHNVGMFRMLVVFLILVACAACNGPTPHFRKSAVTRVTVEGSVFDVRVRGNMAEAQRISHEYAPRFGPIRQRAGYAMAHVSGCRVIEVLGDQALATGVLACEGEPEGWFVPTGFVFSPRTAARE